MFVKLGPYGYNASTPFEACVEIDGLKYGRGQAKNKNMAKL